MKTITIPVPTDWRTTLTGIVILAGQLVPVKWPHLAPYVHQATVILAGFGLIIAKDADLGGKIGQ